MQRRIMGLETEFGVTCRFTGEARLSADEVARYLFRKVVAWGRSSNVFLRNGGRLYLDVGSHPEYATAECDDPLELLAQDRAGEQIVAELVDDAEQRLEDEGVPGRVYLFKNNLDSQGNTFGCHENYLVPRTTDLKRYAQVLLPFLVTRQLMCGAGRLVPLEGGGARYDLSQRADQVWEGLSSGTTRARPIINTRDEPHADVERWRRLHVIVGDTTMSETTTLLKVASTHMVLSLIESGAHVSHVALDNPVRAVRDISRDRTGRTPIKRAEGGTTSALALQQEFLMLCERGIDSGAIEETEAVPTAMELWRRSLEAIDAGRPDDVADCLDWVAKKRVLDRYAAKHGLDDGDPRLQQIALAWHDAAADRGLYHLLHKRGGMRSVISAERVAAARTTPPSTTRAALRGRFIAEAQNAGRDFSVDWVHLKLNDAIPRTVICKDPFAATDERVEALLQHVRDVPTAPAPAP